MKRAGSASVAALLLLPFVMASAPAVRAVGSANSPQRASQAPTPTRAAPGDTVWVVINPVKADKRAQWEEFIRVFWGAGLAAKDPKTRASFTSTRVLFPTRANADGSYSYVFVMDPHIPGNSYGIQGLARLVLPETEAARVIGLMNESRSAPPTVLAVTEAVAAALGRK